MNHYLLLANIGTDLAEMAHDTARTFGVDWPHFIAQVISFSVVAALLYRFAYRPILQVLEERRQRIEEGLANAKQIEEEKAKTEAARQEILAQANTQADQLIAEARAAAARVQEQETQRARAEAEQIIADARNAAQRDHARMLAELRREVGQLVVATTAKVSGKVLTPEDQQRLIQEANQELAA